VFLSEFAFLLTQEGLTCLELAPKRRYLILADDLLVLFKGEVHSLFLLWKVGLFAKFAVWSGQALLIIKELSDSFLNRPHKSMQFLGSGVYGKFAYTTRFSI